MYNASFLNKWLTLSTKRNQMDIQSKKLSLIEWLINLNDERLLSKVESISKEDDFWFSLTAEEKNEIKQGISELDDAKTFDYEDVISSHRK